VGKSSFRSLLSGASPPLESRAKPMPEWTRKEIYEHFEISSAYFATYKKRGKVNVNDEGKIDDKDPVNKEFLTSLQQKLEEKQVEGSGTSGGGGKKGQQKAKKKSQSKGKQKGQQKNGKQQKKDPEPIEPEQVSEEDGFDPYKSNPAAPSSADVMSKTEIQAQHEAQKLEYTKRRNRLLELDRQKKEGEVVPTEEVQKVFAQHFRNVTTAFEEGMENMITEFSHRKGFTDDEVSELRERLVSVVNNSIEKARKASKKDIEGIVSEFSMKREKGERDR